MLTRSRRISSAKNDDSAGNMNANVSAMTDQSTTASAVDNNTVTASDQSAERSSMAKPNTQATQGAREQFESFVMASLEKILAGQEQLKKELDSFKKDITQSVEFQGEEINDLKNKTEKMATHLNNVSEKLTAHDKHIEKLYEEQNKSERFSRRNNLRIVGFPESEGENIRETVQHILVTKFGFEDIEIERAHRDGKVRHYDGPNKGRPRHILIKLLRYVDKVKVLKSWRECLSGESYRVTDDLTRVDLEEKQKWREEVAELYKRGVKLRFRGGMWRDRSGKRAPFYQHTGNPFIDVEEGFMDIKSGTFTRIK